MAVGPVPSEAKVTRSNRVGCAIFPDEIRTYPTGPLTADLGVTEAVRGCFRVVQVWIGSAGSTIDYATHVPPAPEDVSAQIIGEDW
jgi:hypothetical protein